MVVKAGDPEAFPALLRVLNEGGVAIAPGDTMYGLIGAVPDSQEKLRRVKGRGEEKPFLQLLADPTWIARVSDMPVPARLSRFWPGPLTLVLPDRAGGTIAVRVPDSSFLRGVVRAVGRPLYSTSVNRAGSPPLTNVNDICHEFERDVDIIFDDGDHPPGEPSTLLDITSRPYKVLRQGALHLDPHDLS